MVNTASKKEETNKAKSLIFLFIMEKKKIIKDLIPYILVVVIVLLIKAYIITPVKVTGVSMNNTLNTGDIMILDRLSYYFNDIKKGDIVVVDLAEQKLIKRVVALPGDEIYADNNILYINGKKFNENYLDKDTVTDDFTLTNITGKKTVANNMYFVMGDNRQQSADSRVFGLVNKDKILGKANLTIFPFKRMGVKK